MAYVKKIIGSHERLIGIARLHWIYLAKGFIGFSICVILGLSLDAIMVKMLTALSAIAPNAGTDMVALASSWITPLSIIIGGYYFLLYLIKVIYTEIALTDKRVIHKTGFLFVKIEEIDIEEISAENMDMGYFGSILGYAYLMLDCRFVGDIKLPAIGKANSFVKALHAARTHVMPIYPDAEKIAKAVAKEMPTEVSSDDKPQNEMLKPMEMKPYEPPRDENGDIIQKDEEDDGASSAVAATTADQEHEKELLALQIAKLELEVKLKETEKEVISAEVEAATIAAATPPTSTIPPQTQERSTNDIQNTMANPEPIAPSTPPTTSSDAPSPTDRVAAAITSAPVSTPVNVAKAQQSAMPEIAQMPQVTDKIAEELIAQGLIPHPDEVKPEPKFEEERLRPAPPSDEQRLEPTKADPLINDFATSSTVIKPNDDTLKPAPALAV